jgi:CRP/FNR family transcriptional regulator, anaerobic regulatory protein
MIRSDPFMSGVTTGLKRADREHLAAIATPLRVTKDALIYQRGARADAIFNITSGTARAFRAVAAGRRVLAFLFAGDLCGLATKGVYVNSVQALTPVTVFRIPLEPLAAMLRRDADLQFCFLCKAVHALRETQRQAVVTAHRDPVDRLAAFLSMLQDAQGADGHADTIALPMRSRDIAEYVDLSTDAVRAALEVLRREGAIDRSPDRSIHIADRRRFNRRVAGA